MREKDFLICCSVVVMFLVFCLQTNTAHAWGSLAPSRTHQFILDRAYEQLKLDPAYEADLFPTLEAIQENEGVNWTGTAGVFGFDYMKGPGPDSEGASDYSEHYYNPVTREGKGPDTVSKYWQYTARGLQEDKKRATSLATAWGAHFMADMFVPFHVIGASRATIRSLYERRLAERKGDDIALNPDIYGDYGLCYLCPVKSLNHNFRTEVTRYVALGNQGPADWFDPWYYNGNAPGLPLISAAIDPVKTSSHVLWEGAVTYRAYDLQGYSPSWQNNPVNLDANWTDRALPARRFAVSAATDTRNNLIARFQNPEPAVNKAIQSVYTLWRASFTAMRPELIVSNAGGVYQVSGYVFNKALEEATGVELRLSAAGCSITKGEARQAIGTAAPGVASAQAQWLVQTTDTPCLLKIEAAGAYHRTPDLQYAVKKKTIPPLGKAIINMDGPSKMIVDQAVLFIARVTLPSGVDAPSVTYTWTANGNALDSPYDTQKATASATGPYTVRVEAFQVLDGGRVKIGEAQRTFQVTAAQGVAEKKPVPPVAPVSENKECRTLKLHYSNGQLAEQKTVCKPYDYSYGLYSSWYENGQLKEQAFYEKNLINGDYTTWYENGIMKGRIPNVKGVIHGKAETWWENGKRRWIENYKDGKRHGEAQYWDGDGEKTQDCKYENGKELSCKNYEAYRGDR